MCVHPIWTNVRHDVLIVCGGLYGEDPGSSLCLSLQWFLAWEKIILRKTARGPSYWMFWSSWLALLHQRHWHWSSLIVLCSAQVQKISQNNTSLSFIRCKRHVIDVLNVSQKNPQKDHARQIWRKLFDNSQSLTKYCDLLYNLIQRTSHQRIYQLYLWKQVHKFILFTRVTQKTCVSARHIETYAEQRLICLSISSIERENCE